MPFDAFEDFRMDDHVAIITGGAQNIGAGVARTFSGVGAKVMIADLNGEKAEETARRSPPKTGNPVIGIGCDVTDNSPISTPVSPRPSRRLGDMSTLVNNVGWGGA